MAAPATPIPVLVRAASNPGASLAVVEAMVDAANTAYSKQEFAAARELFAKAAASGHALAAFQVGVMYATGKGGSVDSKSAIAYLEAAVAKGDVSAQYVLGTFYETGAHGLTKDVSRAKQLYQSAADQKHPAAKIALDGLTEDDNVANVYELARAAYYGSGTNEPDPAKARALYLQAAEGGVIDAMVDYAVMCGTSDGGAYEPMRCVVWMKSAAELRHPAAGYNMGRYYQYGQHGLTPSVKLAKYYYGLAAKDDPDAKEALDDLNASDNALPAAANANAVVAVAAADPAPSKMDDAYANGMKCREKKDLIAGREFLLTAAKRGHTLAMVEVAWMFARGEGGDVDSKEAVRWVSEVAEKGVASANETLGAFHENGIVPGLPVDLTRAKHFYKAAGEPARSALVRVSNQLIDTYRKALNHVAAPDDRARAEYALACALRDHPNASEYAKAARDAFVAAAEGGNATAMRLAARMYARGEGGAVDSKEAVRWMRASAAAQNVVATYKLGVWHERGVHSLPLDLAIANRYYRMAAERLYAPAQKALRRLAPEFIKKYQSAANAGDKMAQFEMGGALYYADGDRTVNWTKAREWYTKAAESGHVNAAAEAGYMCATGEGGPVDHKAAVSWTTNAANSGNASAQFNLGCFYELAQHGLTKDLSQAAHYYRLAVNNGSLAAAASLQRITAAQALNPMPVVVASPVPTDVKITVLVPIASSATPINSDSKGSGGGAADTKLDSNVSVVPAAVLSKPTTAEGLVAVPPGALQAAALEVEAKAARERYRKAAGDGDLRAMYDLAMMLINGKGGAVDTAEAVRLLTTSAAGDEATALYELGVVYAKGLYGVPKDVAHAERLIAEAAFRDEPRALASLNTSEGSIAQLTAAAAKGDVSAQYDLGYSYYHGTNGAATDRAEARIWFLKAANDGHLNAMREIGLMFADGKGGSADSKSAVKWIKDAAARGDSAAQFELGTFHEIGKHGLPRNIELAKQCFELAAAQKYLKAVEAVKRGFHAQPASKPMSGSTAAMAPPGTAAAAAALKPVGGRSASASISASGKAPAPAGRNAGAAGAGDGKGHRDGKHAGGDNKSGSGGGAGTGAGGGGAGGAGPKGDADAEKPDAAAIFHAANAAYYGEGVAMDLPKARNLYLQAATAGHARAAAEAAYMCAQGEGGAADMKEAFRWYKVAAERRNILGMYNLAVCYETARFGAPHDVALARKWYTLVAAHDESSTLASQARARLMAIEVEAQVPLDSAIESDFEKANAAYYGWSGAVDFVGARKLYVKAAQAGHVRAAFDAAYMYAKGEGGTIDSKEAVRWATEAALKRNPNAQVLLASFHESGLHGMVTDRKSARRLYWAAAATGNADAISALVRLRDLREGDRLCTLANSIYYGRNGVARDRVLARAMFIDAALCGDALAMSESAFMLHAGEGGPVDIREALRWVEAAAEGGDATALVNLARLHEAGTGVQKDEKRALELYRLAAAKGHQSAQQAIRRLEFNETPESTFQRANAAYYGLAGTRKDYYRARELYENAANGDHLVGMVRIASMLANGEGGAVDSHRALRWMTLASDRGEPVAQYTLGLWYERGLHDLVANITRAKELYQLAAAQHHDQANFALLQLLVAEDGDSVVDAPKRPPPPPPPPPPAAAPVVAVPVPAVVKERLANASNVHTWNAAAVVDWIRECKFGDGESDLIRAAETLNGLGLLAVDQKWIDVATMHALARSRFKAALTELKAKQPNAAPAADLKVPHVAEIKVPTPHVPAAAPVRDEKSPPAPAPAAAAVRPPVLDLLNKLMANARADEVAERERQWIRADAPLGRTKVIKHATEATASDNLNCDEYYNEFGRQLRDCREAARVIHTKWVVNSKQTAADYLARGVNFVGDSIPVISIFTNLFQNLMSAYTDRDKQQAVNRLSDYFGFDQKGDILIEAIARELTLHQVKELRQLALDEKKAGVVDRAFLGVRHAMNVALVDDVNTAAKRRAAKHVEQLIELIMKTGAPRPAVAAGAAQVVSIPDKYPSTKHLPLFVGALLGPKHASRHLISDGADMLARPAAAPQAIVLIDGEFVVGQTRQTRGLSQAASKAELEHAVKAIADMRGQVAALTRVINERLNTPTPRAEDVKVAAAGGDLAMALASPDAAVAARAAEQILVAATDEKPDDLSNRLQLVNSIIASLQAQVKVLTAAQARAAPAAAQPIVPTPPARK